LDYRDALPGGTEYCLLGGKYVTNINTVFFSGYAKLPAGITASEMYKVVGIVIIVDMQTEKIVQADCTLVTQVGRDFVNKMMVGHVMSNGIDPLLRELDCRYQGSAKKAIITALKIINDKYRSFQEGNGMSVLD
jgi:hypothetical protein